MNRSNESSGIGGIIFLLVLLIFALTVSKDNIENEDTGEIQNGNYTYMYVIPDKQYLSYDENTKVVYYVSNKLMSPYYDESGHLCRYINGKIIPINN